jgi:hypothetical protein
MVPFIKKLSEPQPITITEYAVVRKGIRLKNINLATNTDFNQLLYIADQKTHEIKNLLESILPKNMELNELLSQEIEK